MVGDDFLQEAKRDIDRIVNSVPIPPYWRETKIEITPMARATDPVNLAREGWWERAEPRDSSGRAVIRLLDRALKFRDSRGETNRSNEWSEAREGTTAEKERGDDAEGWAKYLPAPGDDART